MVEAIAANLPGAAWQRCRTHYAEDLMSTTPSPTGDGSRHSCTASMTNPTPRPSAPSSTGSSRRWSTSCPRSPTTSARLVPTSSRSPPSPRRSGVRSGPTTPTPQPRDPAPHRRRRDLPPPRLGDSPGRRRTRRTARRMGRRTTLPRSGCPSPRSTRRLRPRTTTRAKLTPLVPPYPSSDPQHDHQPTRARLTILAAGGYTGRWDEHGQPAPFPEDFFDPDTNWRPDIQLVTTDPAAALLTRTRRISPYATTRDLTKPPFYCRKLLAWRPGWSTPRASASPRMPEDRPAGCDLVVQGR